MREWKEEKEEIRRTIEWNKKKERIDEAGVKKIIEEHQEKRVNRKRKIKLKESERHMENRENMRRYRDSRNNKGE